MLGHFEIAFACEWFICNEQVLTAFFLIGVVFARDLPRFGRFRRIFVLDEILAHLIHANSGANGSYGWQYTSSTSSMCHTKFPSASLGKHHDFLSHGFSSFFSASFLPFQDRYARHI